MTPVRPPAGGQAVGPVFADLLILPIISIYRKYYGARVTVVIAAAFYAAMVVAGYLVIRFLRGGPAMMRMMGGRPDGQHGDGHSHGHGRGHHHGHDHHRGHAASE
jgi:uncharacterized protein